MEASGIRIALYQDYWLYLLTYGDGSTKWTVRILAVYYLYPILTCFGDRQGEVSGCLSQWCVIDYHYITS